MAFKSVNLIEQHCKGGRHMTVITRTFRIVTGSLCISMLLIFHSPGPWSYAAESKTYEQIKILVDILGYIKENHVKDVETQDLVYGAASGMVSVLDPFSQFMEPRMHKEMKVETKGEFGGLGIRISIKDNWLSVITPIPGTPAYKMGILPNDRIIKIEGESTKGISLMEAVEKMRGKPNTDVTITVAREVMDENKEPITETKDYTITRAIIKIESVRGRMLDDTIGYVRLIEFTRQTDIDLEKKLHELADEGMKNLILDLRNNPGGLLNIAVDVCDSFLAKDQLIVYTHGRDKARRMDYVAKRNNDFEQIPLIVLVNEGSASGSEIVAGALQDNKRAIIMGSRTFGKGSVQSVISLSDGSALRLTTAHYYTPSGRIIHREEDSEIWGVDPNITVDVPREIQAKLRAQEELIFEKGKKPAPGISEEERVEDELLNRAIQGFKTRELFRKMEISKTAQTEPEQTNDE
ncbi:MAG: PDZ domain-containing protein [Elusimicrobia bacterium]|nr:PDZ domain-containing protein [Elusimicrobiota bacterium]MBD3412615.1 PDZ domain-containing protein [Elusimicrobiota bacterium]